MLRHVLVVAAFLASARAFSPSLSAARHARPAVASSSAFAPAVAPISARPASLSQNAHMSLFGLGWPELLVIGGAALLFFGPEKLTDVAKEAGKSASALKDASSAFQEGMQEASKEGMKEGKQRAESKKELAASKQEE